MSRKVVIIFTVIVGSLLTIRWILHRHMEKYSLTTDVRQGTKLIDLINEAERRCQQSTWGLLRVSSRPVTLLCVVLACCLLYLLYVYLPLLICGWKGAVCAVP